MTEETPKQPKQPTAPVAAKTSDVDDDNQDFGKGAADDEVLLMLTRSIWYKPFTFLSGIVMSIAPLVGIFILPADTPQVIRWILAALCLAGLLWLIYYIFQTKICARYTITRRRATAELGFISREIREVEIRHIRNINVRQTIMQRIFGLGDVEISTAAGSEIEVQFLAVHDPLNVRRVIMERK
jgi:uncharacterized membrane protein YdbT with pleckstrin-like domain